MKIEQQVCTLEQAKRLKELGVKQHSFFAWVELEKPELISRHTNRKELDVYNTLSFENISAFTVAELGVMLPDTAIHETPIDLAQVMSCRVFKGKNKGKYCCYIEYAVTTAKDYISFTLDTEAEARAAMLIYLLENNLTTASSVNTRLNENKF